MKSVFLLNNEIRSAISATMASSVETYHFTTNVESGSACESIDFNDFSYTSLFLDQPTLEVVSHNFFNMH